MKKAPQTERLLQNGTKVVYRNKSGMISKGVVSQSYYRIVNSRGEMTNVACSKVGIDEAKNCEKLGLLARIWKAVRNDYVR